jgi:hypothetical protein
MEEAADKGEREPQVKDFLRSSAEHPHKTACVV